MAMNVGKFTRKCTTARVHIRCAALMCLLLLVGCAASSSLLTVDVPVAPWPVYSFIELHNEHMALLVVRPDDSAGFNVASRFDRAGMVVAARSADGTSYFGPIVDPQKHDPTIDDHVAGTAGEFGMDSPLGYEQAKPGDTFVKVGVGVLRRVNDKPYFFRHNYWLVDAGQWEIESEGDRATMTQTLGGPRGWSYVYRTRVELLENEAGFVIHRTLTNTGDQRIVTDHYCHNFIVLDGRAVSPNYRLQLTPKHVVAEDRKVPEWVSFDGHCLRLIRPLGSGKTLWLSLQHSAANDDLWRAAVTNEQSGVVCEQVPVPDRVVVYVKDPYMSVEPFIDIDLKPGRSMTWTARYELK